MLQGVSEYSAPICSMPLDGRKVARAWIRRPPGASGRLLQEHRRLPRSQDRPGNQILSDGWGGYRKLNEKGFEPGRTSPCAVSLGSHLAVEPETLP